MISIGDYNKIMSDHDIFNQIVYTPLSEALRLLEERRNNPELVSQIQYLLNNDIPEILKENKCGVQFRQIATPNNDLRHFVAITKENDLKPIFFEYLDDKFTSNNDFKHSLGQLRVQGSINKKDFYPVEKITIMDFNKHNGKKLKEVNTLWGEPLLDFHRKLFTADNYDLDNLTFYDASLWFKQHGEQPAKYYKDFFLLFICHGILFENFLLNDTDGEFSRNVVLPAIERVMNLTGLRPLVVPIGPIDMELDDYWVSYHPVIKTLIP